MDLLESYCRRGWRLLPIARNDKRPILPNWVNAASSDWYVVQQWLREWPGMNVGVACGPASGFWVMDIDKKAGGLEALQALQQSPRRLPPTLTAKTAGGGFHMLYEALDDFCPRNIKLDRLDRRLAGIETRGEGGQIVVSPSRVNGVSYEWINSERIAPPPRWLVELIERPKQTPTPKFQRREGGAKPIRRVEAMATRLSQMPKDSGRNNFLNWATYTAAQLIREGVVDETLVRSRMTEAARASGLSPSETRATIESAMRSALAGKKSQT